MLQRNALAPFWGHNSFTVAPAIDRFFTTALDVPVWGGGADVKEFDDHAEIAMDLPGVKPEQIQVTAEDRTITVSTAGEARQPVTRQYTVGSKYDISRVGARLELGVLTLTVPKAAEAQPRTVPVTVA